MDERQAGRGQWRDETKMKKKGGMKGQWMKHKGGMKGA